MADGGLLWNQKPGGRSPEGPAGVAEEFSPHVCSVYHKLTLMGGGGGEVVGSISIGVSCSWLVDVPP